MRNPTSFASTVPFALLLLVALLLLPGCAAGTAQPPVPDMTPIGAGLRFIGIGIVVTALVIVLGTSRNP